MRRLLCAWAALRAICARQHSSLKQASTAVKHSRSSINWFGPRTKQLNRTQLMNFLSEIISTKQRRLDEAKKLIPLEQMRTLASKAREDVSAHALLKALSDESKINIIAE